MYAYQCECMYVVYPYVVCVCFIIIWLCAVSTVVIILYNLRLSKIICYISVVDMQENVCYVHVCVHGQIGWAVVCVFFYYANDVYVCGVNYVNGIRNEPLSH